MNPIIDLLQLFVLMMSLALLCHYVRNIQAILDQLVIMNQSGDVDALVENQTYIAFANECREIVYEHCSFLGYEYCEAKFYIDDAESVGGQEYWNQYVDSDDDERVALIRRDVELYFTYAYEGMSRGRVTLRTIGGE